MASVIKIKRSLTGNAAPTGANNEGELAVAFGGAGTLTKPTLFANDGTGWRTLNPAVTIGNATLPGGTPGSSTGIGLAWTNLAVKPAGDIIVGAFAGSAYIKIGAGTNDADWVSLGSAATIDYASVAEVSAGVITNKVVNPLTLMSNAASTSTALKTDQAGYFTRLNANGELAGTFIPVATNAEVLAGAIADKFLTPKALESRLLAAPTGGGAAVAGDVNKLVKLNASGQIDSKFLGFTAVSFKGAIDVTTAYSAPSPAWKQGDFGLISKSGVAHATWNAQGITGSVSQNDLVVFDGTKYDVINAEVNMSAYLALTGTTSSAKMAGTAQIAFNVPTGAGLVTRLDGTDATKSAIDNFTIDAGTY